MPKRCGDSGGETRRPRALFLAPESPYPVYGGGALRAASILHFLAQRYDVDIVTFYDAYRDGPPVPIPCGLVRRSSVITLPPNARHWPARVWRNARRMARGVPPLVDRFAGFGDQVAAFAGGRYDLGVIEHFWCAPYVEQLAAVCDRVVLDLHNIESAWHAGSAAVSRGPRALAFRIFEEAALHLERRWLPQFSLLLATSSGDAERCQRIVPGRPVSVYPNSVPLVERPTPPEEDVIAFSGTLEYEPNRAAVAFFRRAVWPRLRERWPDLRWRLVGRHPEAVAHEVSGDPRIECTGQIEDAVGQLAAAKVVVVPVLAGSGTRLKIIEAWAAARAVVSTAVGAEGLTVVSGENIMIEDDPERFADAVSALLESGALRRRIGEAGRAVYERGYTWQAAWDRLAAALDGLAAGPDRNLQIVRPEQTPKHLY